MPVVKVGDKRIKFPDSMSKEEIAAVLRNQTAAPDAQPSTIPKGGGRSVRSQAVGEQKRKEMETFLSSLSPERRELLGSISPAEAALIGVGRGFTDVARGVGLMDQGSETEMEAFRQLEQAQPVATGGQIIGQAAPFVPAGLGVAGIASTPIRAAATGLLGGTEAATITRGQGADVGEQLKAAGIGATVATALELGLPVLGRLGGKIVRRVTGSNPSVPTISSSGKPSDELLQSLAAEGRTFDDLISTARDEILNQTDDALKATAPLSRNIDKALREAAPTIEQLKAQSRSIYSKIDELGASIKPDSFDSFVNSVQSKLKSAGFDKDLHPKASAVLNRLSNERGALKTTTDIDTLRKVAQSAANSIEPDEKRIGSMILESFDDFMDGLDTEDFIGTSYSGIGKQYKEARSLWSKAKKSELISEAIEKAKDQASGFENGLRVQFRSILNNKKKKRGFSSEELDAMRKVVQGTKMANAAKFLGRFGISEQQATSMLGASVGAGGGAAIGSAIGGTAGAGLGAVAVPAIGQVSKSLAQRLTKNNAALADTIVRAGKDGKKIVQAYFNAVPAKERSSAELAQLLMRPEVSLSAIKSQGTSASAKVVDDAVYMVNTLGADQLRQVLGLTGAAAASAQATGDEQ